MSLWVSYLSNKITHKPEKQRALQIGISKIENNISSNRMLKTRKPGTLLGMEEERVWDKNNRNTSFFFIALSVQ